ncbi:MAG: ATP-binding protein [Spirochaetes bacterium]|nr:ATP-binding protein [Spirochaetota bacterium]
MVLALLGFLCLAGPPAAARELPVVWRGLIDLSDHDFDRDGPVPLNGDWEFHWHRLLAPGDFRERGGLSEGAFAEVPGLWNGMRQEGRALEGFGHATYRTIVRRGGGTGIMALRIPKVYTAYRLWVNGALVSSNGTVGTGRDSSTPEFRPSVAPFVPGAGDLEIVLQVSNYHHREGGIWGPLWLGSERSLSSWQRLMAMFEMFACGGLVIIGMFHLSHFMFRKRDRANLFFGILCLLLALRIPFEGERLAIVFLPWISWELNEKVTFLTLYLSAAFGALYFQRLLPGSFSVWVMRATVAAGVLCSLIVMATPSRIYWFTLYPVEAAVLILILYILFLVMRAAARGMDGAAYMVVGLAIFVVTAIIDLLYHTRLARVGLGNTVGFGLLVFSVSQSITMSKRYSLAFTGVEVLSAEKARLFNGLLHILSSMIRESSSRLYEKTESVMRIAVALAQRMRIPPDEVEDIRLAALLHDLGLVGMKNWMMQDWRKLSDEERRMLENHPLKSIDIIRDLKELEGVRTIISQHHERFNGSGYPLGLKGGRIVSGARILAVADDFVDVLSRRAFQKMERKELVIGYLTENRGVLYDPIVVDNLIPMIEEKRLIYTVNDNDIAVYLTDQYSEWVIPSNLHFEGLIVDKVMEAMLARINLSPQVSFQIEFSLGEVFRNAVVHGNKYDEGKSVVVRLRFIQEGEGLRAVITVTDEGEGINLDEYNRFVDSRKRIIDQIVDLRGLQSSMPEGPEREAMARIITNLENFHLEYFFDFNRYRMFDAGELSGGVGLIHVMQTFDQVDFRNITDQYRVRGMEVTLERYFEGSMVRTPQSS